MKSLFLLAASFALGLTGCGTDVPHDNGAAVSAPRSASTQALVNAVSRTLAGTATEADTAFVSDVVSRLQNDETLAPLATELSSQLGANASGNQIASAVKARAATVRFSSETRARITAVIEASYQAQAQRPGVSQKGLLPALGIFGLVLAPFVVYVVADSTCEACGLNGTDSWWCNHMC